MTRINVVPPSELTDKHLVAEYRELPRVLRRAVLAIESGKEPSDFKIAEHYLLGKGHETFFIDKCEFLWLRWNNLRSEMIHRGMKPQETFRNIVKCRARRIRKFGRCYYNFYVPAEVAKVINRQRIQERLK